MVIKFKNQVLTFDQLKGGKLNKNILSDTELSVIDLVDFWLTERPAYKLTTSGSTGTPKDIYIPRTILEYSARTSLTELNKDGSAQKCLLCIHPRYIGGMMVVIRALVAQMDLTVREPGKDPSAELDECYDLVSMVPLQVQYLLDHKPKNLELFKTILIGGAPLPERYQAELRKYHKTTCYQTYGMTETASHIALRNVTAGDTAFKTLGDIQLDQDDRQCLKIKGTVTGNEWVQTNDVVEISGSDRFIWKGRADFVINSGGIKIHPEVVEAKLSRHLTSPFFIGGLPDEQLGKKTVLFIERPMEQKAAVKPFDMKVLQELDRYEKPKEIIYLNHFDYTDSGKINRTKTIQQINKCK